MKKHLIPALIITAVAFPDSASQTEWHGGPGVPGPVTDWGVFFANALGLNWNGSQDELYLGFGVIDPVGHTVASDYQGTMFVYSSDIDSDGDMDILGSAYSEGNISWWENSDTSPGLFITQNVITDDFIYAAGVHAADIDGDEDMDVLGAAAFDNEIAWWRNIDGAGTIWQKITVDDDFQSAWSVYAADTDGDGDMDILGAAHQGDITSWWENTDSIGNSWTEHVVDPSFDGSCSVRADDLDGDGDLDILGAGRMADEIVWWENTDGIGTSWIKNTISSSFDGACSAYSCDMDSDGDADVIGAAYNANAIIWWENTGGAGISWDEHPVDTLFEGAFSVSAFDVDNDGCMDLIGAAQDDNEVAWFRNSDGSGTVWVRHVVDDSFAFASCVTSADLNDDGLPDIAGASFGENEITWWQVTDHAEEGSLISSILDSGTEADWETIVWNSIVPAGTGVCFQVRTSDDFGNMGIWSDTIPNPGNLDPYAYDGDRYIQYRAILQTEDPATTPFLQDITV